MASNAFREQVFVAANEPEPVVPQYPSAPVRPVADAVQRVIDVVGSALLLVLVSPVLVGAAVAVRLTSRGPAFFWQDRYGRDESTFRVVKLRTMVVDQAQVIDLVRVEELERQGVLSKSDDDPRVTAAGRFLVALPSRWGGSSAGRA